MRFRRGFTSAITLACVVTLAVSCASSDASSSANYVPVTTEDPTAVGLQDPVPQSASTWQAPPVAAGTPVAEISSIVQVFDEFLAIRSRAITGDAELSELEDFATPVAIEQVASLRSVNETKIETESYSALSDLAEWSNITEVEQVENTFRFRDCTESQYITPGGFTVVNFVTTDVSIIEVDGRLKVNNLEVVQDGVASTSDEILGCVPSSFAERAAATGKLAVDQAAALIEDPAAALAAGLPSIFADEARTDLEYGLQSLQNEGLARVADEHVDITVLGMDVNRPDFTVVISVCRTYRTGRSYTDRDGAQTITDIPVGSSYEEWIYVQLEATPSQTSTDVVTEVHDRGPNCERG